MSTVKVSELIKQAENELRNIGYSEKTINIYKSIFNKITQFFHDQGEALFSVGVAMKWLDSECDFSNKESADKLRPIQEIFYRAVRMLTSVQAGTAIPTKYLRKHMEISNEILLRLIEKYTEDNRKYGYANSTQQFNRNTATRLFNYLLSQNLMPDDITPPIISDFIKSHEGYSKATMRNLLSSLRILLSFLHRECVLPKNYSPMLPKVNAPKFASLPSVWKHDDVVKLFAVMDRTNPLEKRDYAILLLGLRLGIRSIDIKKLKIQNFDWINKKIEFAQSKTGDVVSLPLLDDVGWAVIDYLKNGRPRCDAPHIFLRHIVPYESLSESNHLYEITAKYAKRAGLSLHDKHKSGIHSLRHTLATSLLEQGTALNNISHIIGHKDSNTTSIYLKCDVEYLRECALDTEFREEVL